MTTKMRVFVTPIYPGFFFPEEGRGLEFSTFADDNEIVSNFSGDKTWFALQVKTVEYERYTNDNGDENWFMTSKKPTSRRIYVGEILDASQVAALDGDHEILLDNMEFNDWDTVVRTRCGNFQPVESNDTVLRDA